MLRLIRFFIQFKPVRFIVSGGSAACITIGTVYLLTEVFDVWYLIASAVGFVLAVMVNFILQKFWTFRDATLRRTHFQTASFFMVNLFNFFINTLLMFIFVERLHVWPVVAQVCSAVLIAFESFAMYALIFRAPRVSLTTSDNEVVQSELERAS